MTQQTPAEPTAQEMRARLAQLQRDERESRDAQIEAASAPTRNVNTEYFKEQAKIEEQIRNNKPVALPKKSGAEIAAEHASRYPYPKTNTQLVRDEAMEASPKYVQELHGYVSVPLKKSIVLQPQPDPDVLREYNSKRPQPDMAEIMNRPISPTEQRTAELFAGPVIVRPTHPCPNCGDPITAATAFHRKADNSVCILPGQEGFARREGIVIPSEK